MDENGNFTVRDIATLKKAGVPKGLWSDPRVTELDRRELLELIAEGGGVIDPEITEALLEHVQSRPLGVAATEVARAPEPAAVTPAGGAVYGDVGALDADHVREAPHDRSADAGVDARDDDEPVLTDDEWEAEFQRIVEETPEYREESPVAVKAIKFPRLVVALVDQSANMTSPWGDAGMSLAQAVADELNRLLRTLIVDSATFDTIVDRSEVSILAYGGGVRSVLGGQAPIGLAAAAGMSDNGPPEWVVPAAKGSATIVGALDTAAALVEDWCATHRRDGAIVAVYSGGFCADGDLMAAAERVKRNALLVMNVFTSDAEVRAALPRTTSWLPGAQAEMGAAFFNAASEVPLALGSTVGTDREHANADVRARWMSWNDPDGVPLSVLWGPPLLEPESAAPVRGQVVRGGGNPIVGDAVRGGVANPMAAAATQRARDAVVSWWRAGGKEWSMNLAKTRLQRNLQQKGRGNLAAALGQLKVDGTGKSGGGLFGNDVSGLPSPNSQADAPWVPDPNGEVLGRRMIRHPEHPDVTAQLVSAGGGGIAFVLAGVQMQASPTPEGLDVYYTKPNGYGRPSVAHCFIPYGVWRSMWESTFVDAPLAIMVTPGPKFEVRIRWA